MLWSQNDYAKSLLLHKVIDISFGENSIFTYNAYVTGPILYKDRKDIMTCKNINK